MPTLQLHIDVDLNDKRSVGAMLAAFNAIASFQMHAAPGVVHQGPQVQQGPQPGAPAPAAAPKPPRKPRGGAAAAQAPQAPQTNGPAEPELFPHTPMVPQWQQPVAPPSASFGTLGQAPQAAPDLKGQLHTELRNFSTTCGPMALQGLLAYFGCERSSDLPMERVEEIFQYIHAARAQMSQGQNA